MPIDAAPVTASPRGEATAQFFYEWSKATGRLTLVGATADSRDKGTSIAASFPQSMEKCTDSEMRPPSRRERRRTTREYTAHLI